MLRVRGTDRDLHNSCLIDLFFFLFLSGSASPLQHGKYSRAMLIETHINWYDALYSHKCRNKNPLAKACEEQDNLIFNASITRSWEWDQRQRARHTERRCGWRETTERKGGGGGGGGRGKTIGG